MAGAVAAAAAGRHRVQSEGLTPSYQATIRWGINSKNSAACLSLRFSMGLFRRGQEELTILRAPLFYVIGRPVQIRL